MKNLVFISLALLVILSSSEEIRQLQSGWDNVYGHRGWNEKCKNWDETNGRCIECHEGCRKWENICVIVVPYCWRWGMQGDCIQCYWGFGDDNRDPINGTCPMNNMTSVQGNQTTDNNCQCHDDYRQCISCYAGYYLDIDAFCQPLPENCTAADPEGNCTDCVSGFEVVNGTCEKQVCDLSLCRTFNEDQSQCTSCPIRSYLVDGCCIEVNGYCE